MHDFCFSVELGETNKDAVFQSLLGEHVYINYTATKFGEIVLRVEWVIRRQNIVKVEMFTADFSLISSQMRLVNENSACFKFCNTKPNDTDEQKLHFIVTMIPHADIKTHSVASEEREEVLNTNSDEIKNLSEDLLVGLAMDMRDLFIHGDLSDCVVTNGDRMVNVHAAILSARSPVFREMFRDPLHKKVVTIPHASAEALEDMVVFIYSGFIKIKNLDRAEELYLLANEYGIEDLRDVCSLYMSNCTVDHVLRTLILADKHQDAELKKSSMDFILKNIGELKSSEKWKIFAGENMDLVSEIFSSVSVFEKDTLRGFISRLSSKK